MDGRRLVLTRTGPSPSLSLATLDAVGRIKLEAFRLTGAGELGTATRLDGAAGVLTDPVRIRKVLAGPFLLLLLDDPVPFDEIPLCEKKEKKRDPSERLPGQQLVEMFYAEGCQRGDGRRGTFEAVGARAEALEVGRGK